MQVPAIPQTPDQDDEYFRAILLNIVDGNARLANQITETATAATTPEPRALADAAIAHERVARTIRYTIALIRHVKANPGGIQHNPVNRTAARMKIIRGVEDAIHRKRRDVDAERLYAEMAERLDTPEFEFDLETRPADELIEELCRDLGVATQAQSWVWRRRSPTEIAALRTRAAAPPLHLVRKPLT